MLGLTKIDLILFFCHRRPSLLYYNAERDRLDTYSGSSSDTLDEISLSDFSSDGTYPVVQTADVRATIGKYIQTII